MSIRKEKDKPSSGEFINFVRAMSMLTHMGFTMAICVVISVFIGIFLDNLLGTGRVFLIVFILFGVATAFWTAYKMIMRQIK